MVSAVEPKAEVCKSPKYQYVREGTTAMGYVSTPLAA